MKEQIEEILREYWNDEGHDFMPSTGFALKKARKAILKLIPNNDWLKYPKHKPSENNWYAATYSDGTIGLCELEITGTTNLDVIAFKPIPIEPFKPKNKYVEFLNALNMYLEVGDEFAVAHRETLQELKTKIENGDLK